MKSEIEIFRILGALGIVWFHSGVNIGRNIAYGGLIFFVIVSVYFATISTRYHSILERIKRLLIPYILWSVFYGVIFFIKKGHVFPIGYTLFSKVLASPSIHLWYLPFIFISLIVIDYFKGALLKEWVATLLGLAAIFSITLSPIWRELDFAPPLGQYAHAFPAVLIGVFLGVMKKARIAKLLIIAILASIVIMVFLKEPGIGVPYLVGFIPCYFLFNGHTEKGKDTILLKISSATFGVYLIHIFALKVFQKFGIDGYMLPLLAFLLSLLMVVIFNKYAHKKIVKYIA